MGFIFDVFRFAKNFVVWECLRDEEFAPLKNAEGASDFTPTNCRNSLLALHQKWLRIAGAKLINEDGVEARQMGSPAGEDNNNAPDNNNEEKQCCHVRNFPTRQLCGGKLADLQGEIPGTSYFVRIRMQQTQTFI